LWLRTARPGLFVGNGGNKYSIPVRSEPRFDSPWVPSSADSGYQKGWTATGDLLMW
jgi:hypothetical protein